MTIGTNNINEYNILLCVEKSNIQWIQRPGKEMEWNICIHIYIYIHQDKLYYIPESLDPESLDLYSKPRHGDF